MIHRVDTADVPRALPKLDWSGRLLLDWSGRLLLAGLIRKLPTLLRRQRRTW
ncbi:MAG: hypothetical protein KJO75_03455 [Dactylosporangium sp.]|nr:hypothetical protein [Dactylosporangium sp.]